MNFELSTVLEKINGKFICVLEDKKQEFTSKENFTDSDFDKNCSVTSISAHDDIVLLELKPWKAPVADLDSKWAKEYEKQTGVTPNFF